MPGCPSTVVYIYGSSGCGKTALIREVFGQTTGVINHNSHKIILYDNVMVRAGEIDYSSGDYYILISNMAPDDVPVALNEIFHITSAETLIECSAYLRSID